LVLINLESLIEKQILVQKNEEILINDKFEFQNDEFVSEYQRMLNQNANRKSDDNVMDLR